MEGNYQFSRDGAESERLQAQHKFTSALTGFVLHPNITSSLPLTTPSLSIADIGTGTGVFLFDIGTSVSPSTQLHGFDISRAQFPNNTKLDRDVYFHIHDVRYPFEEKYLGKFDIVHVRFLFLGLKSEEWDKAARNMIALLKPGGYIQWTEMNHANSRIFHKTAGAPAIAAKELNDIIVSFMRENVASDPLRIPDIFRDNGMEVVVEELYATDRLQSEMSWHTPMFMGAIGKMVVDLEISMGKREKASGEELVKKAVEETSLGDIYQHSELLVYVAKKL